MATAREPHSVRMNVDSVETTRRLLPKVTKAYLLGILHDGTERKTTFRICQKSESFIRFLARELKGLGRKAWVYKEGRSRDLFVVEFSKNFLTDFKLKSKKDRLDYLRGYFDAEGGIAKSDNIRFYLYFAQKDFKDLLEARMFLEEIGIRCGKIHNPSKRKDPDYWRFFISSKSYKDFADLVGSFHPEKSYLLRKKR